MVVVSTRFLIYLPFILLNFCFVLASCGQTGTKHMDVKESVAGGTTFDSVRIADFLVEYPQMKSHEEDMRRFYRHRNYVYAWFLNGKLIEQAGYLSNRISNLKEDGVYKQTSYIQVLDSLYNASDSGGLTTVKIDLMLTAGYFMFSSLVWDGMNVFVSKENNWFLPRKKVAYNLYLDSLLSSSNYNLSSSGPVYRQYELLKANLRKYRQLDSLGDWGRIKGVFGGRSLALMISQVKNRLSRMGDYQGVRIDTLFDAELGLALIRFQERHGITASGKIDRQTLEELNVPLQVRIRQILVNMERSRWLPVTSDKDYIAVNIPEFMMHVYHADSLLWSCNAVVGKTVHPTTLFYGEINQVVFSPYWNIPESIVAKEINPGIRRDPSFLVKHGMEVIGQRNGLPVVRQKPGPSNALGLVKFLFPNSYSIYLHDTPTKSLFNERTRAFSHGCIRIAAPAKLAEFLLRNSKDWNTTSISTAMHSGKERAVSIQQKVPVYIAYLTAFVDRDLKLNFRKDIYGLDARLASTIITGAGDY